MYYLNSYKTNLAPSKSLSFICITDCHNTLQYKGIRYRALQVIKDKHIDCVFLLGDNSYSDIRTVHSLFVNIPIYTILGNHDNSSLLENLEREFNITDIHNKTLIINDISFIGWGMNKDLEKGNIVASDILLTHDAAFNKFNQFHEGSKEILEYIQKNRTPLHIHGHIHNFQIQEIHKTISIDAFCISEVTIKRSGRVKTKNLCA